MGQATIIYYTSNTENENFENKIRENILKVKGDLPLISVSQKPIDFGHNICVGELGKSYENAFYQAKIGCEIATNSLCSNGRIRLPLSCQRIF